MRQQLLDGHLGGPAAPPLCRVLHLALVLPNHRVLPPPVVCLLLWDIVGHRVGGHMHHYQHHAPRVRGASPLVPGHEGIRWYPPTGAEVREGGFQVAVRSFVVNACST